MRNPFRKRTVLEELQDMQAAAEKEKKRLLRERSRAIHLSVRVFGNPFEPMTNDEFERRKGIQRALNDIAEEIFVSVQMVHRYQNDIILAVDRIQRKNAANTGDELLRKVREG